MTPLCRGRHPITCVVVFSGIAVSPGNLTSSPCVCPEGFYHCAGLCLHLVELRLDYFDAESHCDGIGSHLVTPRSEEEGRCLVASAAMAVRPNGWTWIGFHDRMAERSFTGADGCGEMTYQNWRDDWNGEPDYEFDPNCVDFGEEGTWMDGYCEIGSYALCQLRDYHRPECPNE